MNPLWARLRGLPMLEDRFSSRHNALGLIRLTLASAVLVAHSWPLGLGQPNFGAFLASGQTDLGETAVFGFFVLSGFLVTGSGLRYSLGRYVWHRFLRIFPGLWACLLVTALVIAPLVAIYENGNLDGFWNHPVGPFDYITTNWFASMEQYTISGLLAGTPYGQMVARPGSFDGSLWSLRYELACYMVVGTLIWTAVLRRAPRAVPLLTIMLYALIVRDFLLAPSWTARPARDIAATVPLIGTFALDNVIYLGFLFLLGSVARIYWHRLPMHGTLAAAAALALGVSMWQGGFIVVGLPAYAYLLLYLAVALPGPLQRIGRSRDYSYGIYIYAYPVQQVIALVGGVRYGLAVYILLSALGTLALAVASWHLIERPAMGLKDYKLPVDRWRRWLGQPLPVEARDGMAGETAPIPAPSPGP